MDEYFDDELVLAELLKDGVLFANTAFFKMSEEGSYLEKSIVLFVLCNDLMAWGCADAESITLDELSELYKLWNLNKEWGPSRWVCLKRKEQPQRPVKEAMIKGGVWDEILESLPANHYDTIIRKEYEQRIKK